MNKKFTRLDQWALSPDGEIEPVAPTFPRLEAGAYSLEEGRNGPFLRAHPIVTDTLQVLPGLAVDSVIASINLFWKQREVYNSYGLVYKRGILLYGPPGTGKTATIALIAENLIADDGIVIYSENISGLVTFLPMLRAIEPERKITIVIEELDDVAHYSEHQLLSLLDGDAQIDGVVYLATTNNPEDLPARLVNRPSRFDERVLVGYPCVETRVAYIERATATAPLSQKDLAKWVKDTDGLSIAHIRELVVAVFCLGQEYKEVLSRLRLMTKAPEAVAGFTRAEGA